jgi:hypothetical protein
LFTRILKLTLLGLIVVLALAWAGDYALVKYRIAAQRNMFADLRVDHVYTSTNKWNQIEWSRGSPDIERCVYSLFPHFGYPPCWYLNQRTMQVTNTD